MRRLGLSQSSNVLSAVYDEQTKELTITFKNGRAYSYPNTDSVTADDFEGSRSPGKFVHERLGGRGVPI